MLCYQVYFWPAYLKTGNTSSQPTPSILIIPIIAFSEGRNRQRGNWLRQNSDTNHDGGKRQITTTKKAFSCQARSWYDRVREHIKWVEEQLMGGNQRINNSCNGVPHRDIKKGGFPLFKASTVCSAAHLLVGWAEFHYLNTLANGCYFAPADRRAQKRSVNKGRRREWISFYLSSRSRYPFPLPANGKKRRKNNFHLEVYFDFPRFLQG